MTGIDQPLNARSRRTRTALLDAAMALLEEEDFDALTMGQVAQRAGVSRRGAYLHFGSRAELVGALFEHVSATADLGASLEPVWSAEDGAAAVTAWAEHLARYHPPMLAVDRAIERVRHRDAEAAGYRDRIRNSQRQTCQWLATRLADEERLAPPWNVETATDMLVAQVSSEVIGALLDECGWSQQDLATHLAAMYRATFVAGE